MKEPIVHSLDVCASLDSLTYFVRPVGRSGPGRKFHSYKIAHAWAKEQQMLKGVRHEIAEVMVNYES